MSKAEAQDTAPQIEALEAAGCQRVYEERVSGGRWDRPELHRLLDRLEPGNVLTVRKLERLSRSLKDLLLILDKVEKAGAGFRSLTENIDRTTASGRICRCSAPLPSSSAPSCANELRRACALHAPKAVTADDNPSSRPSSKPNCSPC